MTSPIPVRRGPFAWSTSREIMRRSSVVCWDVNGYYSRLGIGPPYVHATAKDIRDAYLAADGPNDAALTQAFTTFLDPARKAVYDAMPLGQMYPDPETLLRHKINSLGRGDTISVAAEIIDGKIVYDIPEGYEMITGESLDSGFGAGQDDPHVPAKDPYYPYTLLLWDTATFDSLLLERWQHLLIAAAQESYQAPERIGMGVTEGKGGWVTGQSLGVDVVFVDRWAYPTMSQARGMIASMAR